MTLSSSVSRINYVATGSVDFPYPFLIYDATWLQVLVNGTVVTNYSVSGVGQQAGGTVTFTSAPANGAAVAIVRVVPITQETNYVENDPFAAETHEAALDKLTMIAEQLHETDARSLTLALSSTQSNKVVDDLIANRYARAKADVSGIEWVNIQTSGTFVDPTTTKGDLFARSASVISRLPVGNNTELLVADSTQTLGLHWQPVSVLASQIIAAIGATLINTIWPVGSVYTSVVSTNPGTLFGVGTWSAFGVGRVLVGVDVTQTEFDLVEETGGVKTHTLTTAEMPAHTHTRGALLVTSFGYAGGPSVFDAFVTSATGSTGGGGAHNNLQPYITVFMFKRIA